MTSIVDENQIPEHFGVFTLTHNRKPADATGNTVLAHAGHHPKCRLVSVKAMPLVYDTAVDVFAIQDGDAVVAATISSGDAIGISTEGTLVEGQVFERNEAIICDLTTDGNAANATIVTALFETIH